MLPTAAPCWKIRRLSPLLALALACAPAPSATVSHPAVPAPAPGTLTIDAAHVQARATDWCASAGAGPRSPAFFFGALPLASVAALCEPDLADATRDVLLGDLYLSGYLGGVWFREHADFGMEGGPQPGPVDPADVEAVATNAASQLALADGDDPAAIAAHNHEALVGAGGGMEGMMDALLVLYAYNHGYVEAILASPPADADPALAVPACRGYLDCLDPDGPLAAYTRFEPALERLAGRVNERWAALDEAVYDTSTWADVGRALWGQGAVDPGAWDVLVGINAGYLQVTSAAVLASMIGWADGDAAAGRCGVLLETAADTWNRAYFLGLRSDTPEGEGVLVACP